MTAVFSSKHYRPLLELFRLVKMQQDRSATVSRSFKQLCERGVCVAAHICILRTSCCAGNWIRVPDALLYARCTPTLVHKIKSSLLIEWSVDREVTLLLVQVVANADQQPPACQWDFTFELLPAVCSYTQGHIVTLVVFSQAGALLQLAIDTSQPSGCLHDPHETTDRVQFPLSHILPGTLTYNATVMVPILRRC